TSATPTDKKVLVQAKTKGEQTLEFQADKVLVAVGRKPYLEGAVAKDLGLKLTERGRVAVDQQFRTDLPALSAIADIIEGPMVAHKGEEEGIACSEFIAGKPGHVDYNVVPNVIYTHPEVACVGLTEEVAKKNGAQIKIGKFPFVANGRALANDEPAGFAKIIA